MVVERRWRMRKSVWKLLNRAIEPGERLVVLAVGGVALGFERSEIVIHCSRGPTPARSLARRRGCTALPSGASLGPQALGSSA
jgi:hypothetical protein